MAISKITEKPIATKVSAADTVLITQQEKQKNGEVIDVLKRAELSEISKAYVLGYEDELDTYTDIGQVYKIIAETNDGLINDGFEQYFIFVAAHAADVSPLPGFIRENAPVQYKISGGGISCRKYMYMQTDELDGAGHPISKMAWTEWEDMAWKSDLDSKANVSDIKAFAHKGEISNIDVINVKETGIYTIGAGCTGLPENMPAYVCGATLIVCAFDNSGSTGAWNQYLIINDYVDGQGDYTTDTLIYANMVYQATNGELSYDLPWQLILDSASIEKLNSKASAIAELVGDYIIEPVMQGLTERIVFKRFFAAAKYRVYAGSTPLTDSAVGIGTPTVTAAGGFEGDSITVQLYDTNDTLLCEARLNTKTIGNIKTGRLERSL